MSSEQPPCDAETRPLLRLSLIPGLGPRHLQRLVEAFGSASQACAAPPPELRAVPGFGPELVRALIGSHDQRQVERELADCRQRGLTIVGRDQPGYPRLLSQISDPPTVLYLRGELQRVDELAVAIVGTRHASPYGRRHAERLGRGLSRVGLTIVSGLARGIDAVAHRAALAVGGRTLAVLANGLANVYPPEHAELADAIAGQGVVLSEMGLATKPRRGAFPRRNRLISGLAQGVIVIEATERSGALITARHALEQGREVFALPGPVESRSSRGCHQLIRDGAKLVESIEDVLDELGPLPLPVVTDHGQQVHQVAELQLNEQERQVLQAIHEDLTRIDSIVQRSGLSVHRVLSTLSVLETRHLIRRVSGDRVTRRSH